MWDWLNCHLFGRHETGIWCDGGTIFLRCLHCGKRSHGWEVTDSHASPLGPLQARARGHERRHHLELVARRGA